jgi:glutaredoxin
MTVVTLYGKADCHLCEVAHAMLIELQADVAFELQEVDISMDPALAREYGTRIPVIEVDGTAVAELRVDRAFLRRLLAGPASTPQ